MGRPSIVTDAPGCRETVTSGKTGYLIPPKNSQALCDAMITIADSNELRKSMGAAARDFCVEKYAVKKVNQSLIQHLGL